MLLTFVYFRASSKSLAQAATDGIEALGGTCKNLGMFREFLNIYPKLLIIFISIVSVGDRK